MNDLTISFEDLIEKSQKELSPNIGTDLLKVIPKILKRKDLNLKILILQGFCLFHLTKFVTRYIKTSNVSIFMRDVENVKNFFSRNPKEIIEDFRQSLNILPAKILSILKLPLLVIIYFAVNDTGILSKKSITSGVNYLITEDKSEFSDNTRLFIINILSKIAPIILCVVIFGLGKIIDQIISYINISSKPVPNNPVGQEKLDSFLRHPDRKKLPDPIPSKISSHDSFFAPRGIDLNPYKMVAEQFEQIQAADKAKKAKKNLASNQEISF